MSIATVWAKIPGWGQKALIVLVLVGAAFLTGRFTAGKTTTIVHDEVKVRDEEWTKQQVASAQREWERATHKVEVHTITVVKPCPQPPAPADGCKPPCATDCSKCPSQVISDTTTTTTDTTSHGSSSNTTTDTSHGSSHETDTTHDTTTIVQGGGLGLFGTKGMHLTLGLSGGAANWTSPTKLTSAFFLGVDYTVIGPLGAGIVLTTDKDIIASGILTLGRWSILPSAGVRWGEFKPYYGGQLDYRFWGPLQLGAWAYSSKAAGLSLSVTIP